MRWTKAYRKTHGKELMYDSTLDFEKRREEPVRYNRDLYIKTVQAIGKIEKNKAVSDKYKEKNRASIAAQLAQLKQKKSKLQNELIPNEDEESDVSESENYSDMEEENMDDIQA